MADKIMIGGFKDWVEYVARDPAVDKERLAKDLPAHRAAFEQKAAKAGFPLEEMTIVIESLGDGKYRNDVRAPLTGAEELTATGEILARETVGSGGGAAGLKAGQLLSKVAGVGLEALPAGRAARTLGKVGKVLGPLTKVGGAITGYGGARGALGMENVWPESLNMQQFQRESPVLSKIAEYGPAVLGAPLAAALEGRNLIGEVAKGRGQRKLLSEAAKASVLAEGGGRKLLLDNLKQQAAQGMLGGGIVGGIELLSGASPEEIAAATAMGALGAGITRIPYKKAQLEGLLKQAVDAEKVPSVVMSPDKVSGALTTARQALSDQDFDTAVKQALSVMPETARQGKQVLGLLAEKNPQLRASKLLSLAEGLNVNQVGQMMKSANNESFSRAFAAGSQDRVNGIMRSAREAGMITPAQKRIFEAAQHGLVTSADDAIELGMKGLDDVKPLDMEIANRRQVKAVEEGARLAPEQVVKRTAEELTKLKQLREDLAGMAKQAGLKEPPARAMKVLQDIEDFYKRGGYDQYYESLKGEGLLKGLENTPLQPKKNIEVKRPPGFTSVEPKTGSELMSALLG